LSIPNFITLGRILLVPVVFWLLVSGQTRAAFLCFLIAGVSDAIDGFLAKRYHWQTELGAYLDPLADKVLIVSIFIALGVSRELPLWLVVAVVARDILIVAGVLLCRVLERPMTIRPLAVSKANTAAQIALAGLVLADTGFTLGFGGLRTGLVWITGTLTLLSLAAYMMQWLSHMRGTGDTGDVR
jgi:cardiolipin synthase